MAERESARTKLRAHFLANVGRVMDSDELRESDQLQVLEWLVQKYPAQARKLLDFG